MIRNIFFIAIATLLLAGCRKEMPAMQNPRTDAKINNWAQLFESYWSGMNYNYVFWDIDPTDWDEVRREYKSKFDALADKGFDDKDVNDEAFDMIRELSSTLIDGHFMVEITLWDTTYQFNPSYERILKRSNYHKREEFDPYLINTFRLMIGEGRLTNFKYASNAEDDNTYIGVGSGVLEGDIVYFRLGMFGLIPHYETDDYIGQIIDNYHDLLDNYPDVKGVVIDLRCNRGGYLVDMPIVLGKLMDKERIFCYTRQKNGIGRLDYTPWVPETIKPTERKRKLDVPVVVLADMNSISMAEMTTMAVLTLPNGCFIGETMWGGNGTLVSSNSSFDTYYGGYFNNNVILAYTTMTMMKDTNGMIHEGVGIRPTIEVPYDAESFANGTDVQLERAVEYIRTGE